VSAKKVGVIAGAFNPVTRAHIALADAARAHVEDIVFAIPRAFPHKEFAGANLEHRIEMLRRACGEGEIEVTDGGLFVEIAREVRRSRPGSEIYVVCGRDAAERVVEWNYEEPATVERMFQEIRLLVADRQGTYRAPDHLRTRIHSLALPPHFDDVSSSEIRRCIAAGETWEHFVPESIVDLVREIYGSPRSS
jgi:nicotinate (nicotinamide) nucleotide adenylyltransferase